MKKFVEIRRIIQHDVYDVLNLAEKTMQRAYERRHVLSDFFREYVMLKLSFVYNLKSVRKQKLTS